MGRKFYITTAIDYVNAPPHLGHAYEKVTADCIARAHRALGFDTFFLIGNDEHGTKIEKVAAENGTSPQAWADRMDAIYRETYEKLHISWDGFIRTSEPRHHAGVKEILRRVRENGWIRQDKYTGWYCEGCEAFYTDKDLVDGKCPNHATVPKWVEEENWFFRLSDFRDRLLAHIRENPGFVRPDSRRNEVVAFLEAGLQDLSISRAGVKWGIPFPDDPDHVVYVWFDALTNYLTGVGFGTDEETWRHWWPADVHVVGKDITRFHCVIWPAMLMAAEIPLPVCVFGHGFIYQSGSKMSKSLGNIVNPLDVIEVTGPDALRYFLIRELTYGKDGDFSWEAFIGRYNAELANDLGNLVKRTTDMTTRFLGGEVPAGGPEVDRTGLREVAARVAEDAAAAYAAFDLSGALGHVWTLVRRANQAIQEAAPWALAKEPDRREELAGVLGELLETIRIVAELAEPAIPGKAAEIRTRLGLAAESGGAWEVSAAWRDRTAWKVAPGDPVFPRIDHKAEAASAPAAGAEKSGGESKRARKKAKQKSAAPPESIDIGQFKDVELLVAQVISAEPVEGADRLLRLQLDIGTGEPRQVVSGIAEHFRPEDLPGRRVILVANLAPATIRGVESRGMILAAEADGRLTLLDPGGEQPPGTRVT